LKVLIVLQLTQLTGSIFHNAYFNVRAKQNLHNPGLSEVLQNEYITYYIILYGQLLRKVFAFVVFKFHCF